jgi:predicted enzyme related to lactoylglutathione lyase
MAVFVHNVVIDCANPVLLADFWADALGYTKETWNDQDGAAVFDPEMRRVRLLFMPVPGPKPSKNRLHLDLQPLSSDMESEVERLTKLGASVVENVNLTSGAWTGRWTILQDPEGNEFCVGTGGPEGASYV